MAEQSRHKDSKKKIKISACGEKMSLIMMEKEMAPHSSVLAWRIPGMGEPGGLPSMGVTQSATTEAS